MGWKCCWFHQHESFLLLLICHARSRFARDSDNIAPWTMQHGLKLLSIWLDVIQSTQIVSPVVDSSCRKLICARRDSVRIKWSRKVYKSTEVCCHLLRTRKVHVSLFHGSWLPVERIEAVDQHCVNQVESKSASHESTQLGCIGHGWEIAPFDFQKHWLEYHLVWGQIKKQVLSD